MRFGGEQELSANTFSSVDGRKRGVEDGGEYQRWEPVVSVSQERSWNGSANATASADDSGSMRTSMSLDTLTSTANPTPNPNPLLNPPPNPTPTQTSNSNPILTPDLDLNAIPTPNIEANPNSTPSPNSKAKTPDNNNPVWKSNSGFKHRVKAYEPVVGARCWSDEVSVLYGPEGRGRVFVEGMWG